MPYKRNYKKTAKKRIYKKKLSVAKRYKRKSITALIKKISLKNVETKQTHRIQENININHNSGYIINQLLYSQQGITDTDTGTAIYNNRIGDEVIGRGISIKFWVANKLDRPNVMYRLIVFKYSSQSLPTLSTIFTGANGNRMMDKIDSEYITPVYQKIFNLQMGFSAVPAALVNGDQEGREAHTYKKIWIPLKNKRIRYANGGTVPKFIDYGFAIIPYDSYGTLTTDNIASFAFEYTFYFKDA